jgi:hypothetical protein
MIYLLISAGTSIAQDTVASDSIANVEADSLENQMNMLDVEVAPGAVETDTLPQKTFFSGVELKIDYGKLLTLWTEFESKYEAGINFRFLERIVVATEFGYAELNPLKAYDNALFYTIKGMYARAGLDYYTAYDPSNFYYLGLRYAMSNFEDEGQFLLDSDYWEDYEEGFGSQDISASWVELVLGTETYLKISKKSKETGKSKLLIGWNARLRILTDFQNREEPRIYAIPGFGRTFNNFVPAINFYLKYRIGS